MFKVSLLGYRDLDQEVEKGREKLITSFDLLAFGFSEIAEGMTAFRLSEKLLVSYLRKKVARLSKQETFERFPSLTRGLAKDGLGDLTADGDGEVVKEEKDGKKLDDLLALKAGSSF